MNMKRAIAAGAATVALAVGMSVGVAGAATAAPASTAAVTATAAETPTWEFRFNLLAPNAPVTFTVDGKVVGTGTTNSNGDVSFFYSPVGLKPGYYKLYAHTLYGIWSSSAFGVR